MCAIKLLSLFQIKLLFLKSTPSPMINFRVPNSIRCAISLLQVKSFILFISCVVLFAVVSGRIEEKESGQVSMNKNMRAES